MTREEIIALIVTKMREGGKQAGYNVESDPPPELLTIFGSVADAILAGMNHIVGVNEMASPVLALQGGELVEAARELLVVCEADFTSPGTELGDGRYPDEDTVAFGGGSLKFGHIRRLRAAVSSVEGLKDKDNSAREPSPRPHDLTSPGTDRTEP